MRIHLHAADPVAGAAVDAGLAVHPDPDQAEPLEQGIEGPERADVFAEGPVDHHRSREAQDQQEHLPPEEPSERRTERIIEQHMRHPALQRPDGTHVFAEKRIPRPVSGPVQEGQPDHQDCQDNILQISQRTVDFVRNPDLPDRDLIQKLLQQTEQAEPAADEPADGGADEDQPAQHIQGKASVPFVQDGLQGADGTGTQRARTGIAVHPRDAEMFERPLIQHGSARYKSSDIGVRENTPSRLYDFSDMLNQGRYTPCRSWRLS